MKKIVALALFSTSLFAADFTVSTAETATRTLAGNDAVGTITDTGSITVTESSNGVTMNSDSVSTGQQVTNDGAISTAAGVGILNNPGGGRGCNNQ